MISIVIIVVNACRSCHSMSRTCPAWQVLMAVVAENVRLAGQNLDMYRPADEDAAVYAAQAPAAQSCQLASIGVYRLDGTLNSAPVRRFTWSPADWPVPLPHISFAVQVAKGEMTVVRQTGKAYEDRPGLGTYRRIEVYDLFSGTLLRVVDNLPLILPSGGLPSVTLHHSQYMTDFDNEQFRFQMTICPATGVVYMLVDVPNWSVVGERPVRVLGLPPCKTSIAITPKRSVDTWLGAAVMEPPGFVWTAYGMLPVALVASQTGQVWVAMRVANSAIEHLGVPLWAVAAGGAPAPALVQVLHKFV